MAFSGKGLDHLQLVNHIAEVFGGKLSALIGMKHDAIGNAPQPDRVPQGVNCQKAVNPAANPASDDFSGKEVQDGADVMEPSADIHIGKVTDPYQIGGFLVKAFGKKIFTDASFIFANCRFGRFHSAHFGQPHLFHQPVHATFANGDAMLPRETKGHLLYA